MKRLKKKEVLFISNRLLQIDLTIMKVLVTKEMDNIETVPCFVLEHSFYASGFLQVYIYAFICNSTVFILFMLSSLESLFLYLFAAASLHNNDRISML